MLRYSLLDTKGHFFCTQPSKRQPQPQPRDTELLSAPVPQRRSLSPEPPCTGAAADSRCSTRGGTQAHLAANPPAPPKGCAKHPHESSGGQSLPADRVKARSPSRNSSTLLFLPVKIHVFFPQACKLGFLKNLKYVVTEAAYSNTASVLGAVLWEDQPSFFLSELSSP